MKTLFAILLLELAAGVQAYAGDTININKPAPADNAKWTFSENDSVVRIITDGDYVVTGTSAVNRIVINKEVTATVTLQDVNIRSAVASPFMLSSDKTVRGKGSQVTLILLGSNSLTTTDALSAGLTVEDSARLTIEGAGSLLAQGAGNASGGGAGIGAGSGKSGGTVIINSGNVTASGGFGGAGIIGGAGISGNILITGGKVTATGGEGRAGISNDWRSVGGDIAITGGTVTATGGQYGPGIGNDWGYSGGRITISGGTVNAIGGNGGAGIGGGLVCSGGAITISGGNIVAEGGVDAAGIGGGYTGSGESITITGGTVIAVAATSDRRPAGIGGGGGNTAAGTVTVTGGTVYASSSWGTGVGSGGAGTDGSIIVRGGTVIANSVGKGPGIGMATGGSTTATSISGQTTMVLSQSINTTDFGGAKVLTGEDIEVSGSINAGDNSADIIFYSALSIPGGCTLTIPEGILFDMNYNALRAKESDKGSLINISNDRLMHSEGVVYLPLISNTPADSIAGTTLIDLATVTDDGKGYIIDQNTITITRSGKYVITGASTAKNVVVNNNVTADITLDNVDIESASGSPFSLSSDSLGAKVTLRLEGKNTLGATDTCSAGLTVESHAALIIEGDGSLLARGADKGSKRGGAGIGSGSNQCAGSITINSGTIQAAGGLQSAGIGGGFPSLLYNSSPDRDTVNGGVIVINGGVVTATGGDRAAGIGGSFAGMAESITVNGGVVTATGGVAGAGIGSGDNTGTASGSGGIAITGGAVRATGGNAAAGIGGGNGAGGGNIAISGGTIIAVAPGNDNAGPAGIGSGGNSSSLAGIIHITGGAVYASSGTGPGIGGCTGAVGGTVNISGGTVVADAIGNAGYVNISGQTTLILSQSVDTQNWGGVAHLTGDSVKVSDWITPGDNVADVTLYSDFTLPKGVTLTIPAGIVFDVNHNALITGGTIINNGTLRNAERMSSLLGDIQEKWISGIPSLPFTYTGDTIRPAVTVTTDSMETLIAGMDYTVDYADNVNAGTATVTITGRGDYAGVITKRFTINPKNISATWIEDIPAQTYTGSPIKPVIMYDGDKMLSPDKDYTADYSDNLNAGTALVIITGINNYTGSATTAFTILPKRMGDDWLELPEQVYYTGDSIKAIVCDGMRELRQGIDYSADYSNNLYPGTASVVIIGINNYMGNFSRSFTILKRNAENNWIQPIPDQLYTGLPVEPPVVVDDGNRTLIEGTDYAVFAYENNVDTGLATVTVVCKGGYAGTISGTFVIAAENASNWAVAGVPDSAVYTGDSIKPAITVRIANNPDPLRQDIDYAVRYRNNLNVGTATVIIEGIGNQAGWLKSETFAIVPKSFEGVEITVNETCVYDGAPKQPQALAVKDGERALSPADYRITGYGENIYPGESAGSITLTGTGNYTAVPVTGYFTIHKAVPSKAQLSYVLADIAYDGLPHAMEVKLAASVQGLGVVTAVKYNGRTTAPTDRGTYTVTADISEGSNYTAVSDLWIGDFSISDWYYRIDLTEAPDLTANTLTAQKGQPVTLTVTQANEYFLEHVSVFRTDNPNEAVVLTVNDTTCTFTMPGYDVSVRASVKKKTAAGAEHSVYLTASIDDNVRQYVLITPVPDTVLTVREGDSIPLAVRLTGGIKLTAPQLYVNGVWTNLERGADEFLYYLVIIVGNEDLHIEIRGLDIVVNVEGIIESGLRAVPTDGGVWVSGLTPGANLGVYTLQGQLVYQSNATAPEEHIPLRERGVYILRHGNATCKFNY